MADFQKVVDALAVNNAEEKARDSNLNQNIAALRDSNKAAFTDFIVSTTSSSNGSVFSEVQKENTIRKTNNFFIILL